MKQVIVELPDEDHAALKQRAADQMRKLGAQLLFEAKLAVSKTPAARRRAAIAKAEGRAQ